jgi:uncharacterized membrane protein
VFLSYVLSFIFIGIYWNNHHHLLRAAEHVNGAVLWANLHLLFWLSLVFYFVAIPMAFVYSWLSCALYVVVAIIWLIPDTRIERTMNR